MDSLLIADRLLANAVRDDFAGYDPFDLLNSTVFRGTLLYRIEIARLAWLQLGKRSLINFRSVVGVPKMRNPKCAALFILGLLQDYERSGNDEYLALATELGNWVVRQACDLSVWGHHSWGYHFDWQARAFFVPAGTPNIVSTTYVARALYALGSTRSESRFTDAALDSSKFISKHLLTESSGRRFFAYIPGEKAFVHNASLWGAAWCAISSVELGSEDLLTQAQDVIWQSLAEQRTDGSWVYGARSHHQFIDGFHTGYNLEALELARLALRTSEFDGAISRGLNFYRSCLLEADGTAKYFSDSRYPLDMHSFAQAILTLLKIGSSQDIEFCRTILNRAVETLYMPGDGRFAFQRGRLLLNRVDYIRWTQAWAYYSIATFNRIFQSRNAAH